MGRPRTRVVGAGQRFGRLLVVDPECYTASSERARAARVQCDCGVEKLVAVGSLLSGLTVSCGCVYRETRKKRTLAVAVGQEFGRLRVLAEAEVSQTGKRMVQCRCECGTDVVVLIYSLVYGSTTSCGCAVRDRARVRMLSHGLSKHPLYRTWNGMMRRCYRTNLPGYSNYGGRGIVVCERWHDVAAFIEDIERDLGPRPEAMSLDRYPDKNGNYEPGNVRWATDLEQIHNRRSVRELEARVRELEAENAELRKRLGSCPDI